jgi:hypothetical protein
VEARTGRRVEGGRGSPRASSARYSSPACGSSRTPPASRARTAAAAKAEQRSSRRAPVENITSRSAPSGAPSSSLSSSRSSLAPYSNPEATPAYSHGTHPLDSAGSKPLSSFSGNPASSRPRCHEGASGSAARRRYTIRSNDTVSLQFEGTDVLCLYGENGRIRTNRLHCASVADDVDRHGGTDPLSANVSETATPTEFSVEGRAWTSP